MYCPLDIGLVKDKIKFKYLYAIMLGKAINFWKAMISLILAKDGK